MKDWIIEKLKLKVTPLTFAQSFVNNIKIYYFVDDIYCAMCDKDGKASADILFTRNGKWLMFEVKMVGKFKPHEILDALNQKIPKQ